MSIATISSGFLTLKPKISVDGEILRARSSLLVQAAFLFGSSRYVVVDRGRGKIGIRERRFWFARRQRVIPFERVDYIDFDYGSIGTSWGGMMRGFERTDQIERYTVSLVLKDPVEAVPLFCFAGEGACQTGWGGVLLGGDSLVDYAGDQADASREFVELLKEFLEVSVGKPYEAIADQQGRTYVCEECGHTNSPSRSTCLYCGGAVVAAGNADTT